MNRRWAVPIAIGFLISATVTAYNLRYPNYDPDQHIFGTMLLKDKNPDLFQRDFFFSDPDNYKMYIPWYRALAGWVVGDATGESLLRQYNLLLFPSVFIFTLGFYALFRHLTSDDLVAWMAVLAMIPGRQSLSVNPFGIGLAQSMVALKLFFAGVPWIILILIHYHFSRRSVWVAFSLLGILSNIHPILGIGLTCILASTLLVCGERGIRVGIVLSGLALFVAGFSPFILEYWQTRPPVDFRPLTANEFWEAFPPVWGYLPVTLKGLRNFMMDATPLICFSVLAIQRRGISKENVNERFFVSFGICTILASGGVSGILQIGSAMSGQPPIIGLEPMRWTTFIYIFLFPFALFLMTDIRRGKYNTGKTSASILFWVCVFLMFAQKEFPFRRVAREIMLKNGIYSQKRMDIWSREQQRWRDLMDVTAWTRQNSSVNDLFFHPHYDFRFYAQRAIVVGWKDGSMLTRTGSDRVREWLERTRTVRASIDSDDPARVMEAASHFGCEYIILRSGEGPEHLPIPTTYQNPTYRVYRVAGGSGKS